MRDNTLCHVHEASVLHAYKQSTFPVKISSNDLHAGVGNDKNSPEYVVKAKIQCEEQVPKVVIEEPLMAQKPNQSCLCFCSVNEGGMTLTSAPVSMRNRWPELASIRKNKRLGVWPAPVTTGRQLKSFSIPGKGLDIFWPYVVYLN